MYLQNLENKIVIISVLKHDDVWVRANYAARRKILPDISPRKYPIEMDRVNKKKMLNPVNPNPFNPIKSLILIPFPIPDVTSPFIVSSSDHNLFLLFFFGFPGHYSIPEDRTTSSSRIL